ncbi:MAG: AcrB/AcrD/AcrF family protein [Proteobacteria bacterium]|nr:MAG: AcrB/AcrD/AcrF family protein [Pseudomonadota bacterium]
MSLAEISIRRPVFAWMIMLALILFGSISFTRLGVSYLPDVDFPVLNISVTWEGAAPEVMEAEIVDRLEQSLVSVEGLKEMSSSIKQGQATVTLEFELERDVDVALQEVVSAISRVRLPPEVDPPTIRKSNPEDQPIMWLGISSETRSLRELINYVDLVLKDQFQILPGVGEVALGGFTDRNLRVWVKNEQLKRHELTILDVRDAIQRGHLETAAGVIESKEQEYNIRVMGEGLSPQEVENVLITTRGGQPIFGAKIRIADVARVEDGLADVRRVSRVNGVPGVGLGIRKQRGSNAVAVAAAVRKRMAELESSLPKDIALGVNFDSTIFVKEAVEETEFTLVLSAIVTGIVCWLFLGSLRPTFNILLSIPTSIIGTLTVVFFSGFTLNLFTILALALAVGIVVDDAIMVLENIYRHKALGKDRVSASRDGANEITFAALAATVAVIAIFLPVAFMQGVIGKFFFQFGVTLSTAVALSLLEALTLTPMRCAEFMEESQQRGVFARAIDRIFSGVAGAYSRLLAVSLKFRWLVIFASIAVFSASLQILPLLRKEFIPPQDQGSFLVRFETPVGTSLESTSDKMRQAEEYFRALPEVIRMYAAIGGFGGGEVNTGVMFISLKPRSERAKSQQQIMQETRQEFAKFQGLKAFIQDQSTRGFTAQRGFPVEFNIRGPDWEVLNASAAEIMSRLEDSGLVADLNNDYRLGQPEVRVVPNRDAAATRGVSIQTITDTVTAAIGGMRQGKFTQDGRRYDVRIRLEKDERSDPGDILRLDVRNQYGEMIPISEVVHKNVATTLQTITRRNRERSITVYANVAEGKSQAEALDTAQNVSEEVLPDGYRFILGGGAQTFTQAFQSLYFVLWLGVAVAYMVLASQFNSYIHPFTVLLALPFSLTGAFAALYLAGQSINLYSMIGIVLLMGIVKKNSILLVEFANHKREHGGLRALEAMQAAGPIRLRPILMTSCATIAAALPPALALGPGAESRIPMSITIVGGVLISTLFTLLVVPCAYTLLAKLETNRAGR